MKENILLKNSKKLAKNIIAKLEIALKECYETEYWLELLLETNNLDETTSKQYLSECGTIRRLLISSCNTAKQS